MTIPADARRQVIQRAEFCCMNRSLALAIRREEAIRHRHPPSPHPCVGFLERHGPPARSLNHQPSTLNHPIPLSLLRCESKQKGRDNARLHSPSLQVERFYGLRTVL